MKLLDGQSLARERRQKLRMAIQESGIVPGLGSILVGNNAASQTYLRLKARACADDGLHFERFDFPETVHEDAIIGLISTLNERPDIHGILLQLPLPHPLVPEPLIIAISPKKDVDGFHPKNLAAIESGDERRLPVLLRAVLVLLAATGVPLEGKSMVVLGKSDVFLKPFQPTFERRGLAVTTLHGFDPERTRTADIIVTALGQPGVLQGGMVKNHAILIDIGSTPTPRGMVGDVDATSVAERADWLTPVPGGVGPMTIAMLMENTARAAGVALP